MPTAVKICGLTEPQGVAAAVAAGARYLGFVFFEKSPRHVTLEQAAALAAEVPLGIAKVGLFVNPGVSWSEFEACSSRESFRCKLLTRHCASLVG